MKILLTMLCTLITIALDTFTNESFIALILQKKNEYLLKINMIF